MVIKIGIMGTHGVGKTTLARRLAWIIQEQAGLNAGMVTEVARTCRLKLNREATVEAQQWLFHRQFVAEIELGRNRDVLVCDRTVMDPLAYGRVNGMIKFVGDSMTAALGWMGTYDAIVFLRPNGKPIEHDGFRDTSPVFQQAVDSALDGWIDTFGIPVTQRTLEALDERTLGDWACSIGSGAPRLREIMGCDAQARR